MHLTSQFAKLTYYSANVRWALRLSWRTNPRITGLYIGSAAVQSLLPPLLVLTLRQIINSAAAVLNDLGGSVEAVLGWLGVTILLTLLDAIISQLDRFYKERLADDFSLRINTEIMAHAATIELARFDNPEFQDMVERAQRNIAMRLTEFLSACLRAGSGMIQLLLLFAILAAIEPLLIAAAALIMPIYAAIMIRLARENYLLEHRRATSRRWARYYTAKLLDKDSVPEVRFLSLAPELIGRFRRIYTGFRDENRGHLLRRLWAGIGFMGVSLTVFFLLFARVLARIGAGSVTLGDIAVMGGALSRLSRTGESVVLGLATIVDQSLHISNLRDYYEIPPAASPAGQVTPLPDHRGEVLIDNVSFGYPGQDRMVLNSVSLTLHPGETLALVGENGSGKTTLTRLIARIYQPASGTIRFNGHDLHRLPDDFLLREIAFVFQQYGRYEATAADNIAFGDIESLLGRQEQIEAVARYAGIDEMVRDMPRGYKTHLGKMFGDYEPSGGMWQKLALARALARDASLLILDEPTSSLDARAEYELFMQFRTLARGRTTLLISHRFSTVSMADRIAVLAEGRIVETGSHKDLLRLDGHYAHLYRLHEMQMSPGFAE